MLFFLLQKKQFLMKNLLAPCLDKFSTMYEKLLHETDEDQQAAYAEIINQAISYAR